MDGVISDAVSDGSKFLDIIGPSNYFFTADVLPDERYNDWARDVYSWQNQAWHGNYNNPPWKFYIHANFPE